MRSDMYTSLFNEADEENKKELIRLLWAKEKEGAPLMSREETVEWLNSLDIEFFSTNSNIYKMCIAHGFVEQFDVDVENKLIK